uniref:Predicted nuclease, contains PIN domain, potential toxin-antitoxin system component n=1 Tax=Candidatus Kentrum sp. FM TaxID=2126340 RepID=A0A450SGG3_9GAMM|nr:MAG: Predicted nuclease, contains PIN domain, potential toxin-antitoxin system component [Candidatus Kentron sp. FM]VFJ52121.1 MAG: Predicted nuclease, contains PIN domain, potential toxin-antitoxin system component [Candidatus Kentron sp. FM]VFK09124.1 MAG: Predicted nuclease, contains PIN domain, potential toxin-antitoxin system component [Candidatus Kentron sp. FM]
MAKYLIDVNLPRYFSLWSSAEYEHVVDIDDEMKDSRIWSYAKEHNVTIVTKDTDFSEIALLSEPPPRVIHIRLGNMKMREFHQKISTIWPEICVLSDEYKLVRVYRDRIECID